MRFLMFLKAAERHIAEDIEIRYKNESGFWRAMPKKMMKYWTTLGSDIWAPSRSRILDKTRLVSNIAVLLHECRHIEDSILRRFAYYLGYTFPQVLAPILVIVSIAAHAWFKIPWDVWWSIGVSCLALLPWPSPTRARLEGVAYAVGTWFIIRRYRNFEDRGIKEEVVKSLSEKAFNSWVYYKMSWGKRAARKRAEAVHKRALMFCYSEMNKRAPKAFTSQAANEAFYALLDEPFTSHWRK